VTDTLTLCAQLAAWHRDRGDEWAAGHIDRMNHAEQIRLAEAVRGVLQQSTDSTAISTAEPTVIHSQIGQSVEKNLSYTSVIPQGHRRMMDLKNWRDDAACKGMTRLFFSRDARSLAAACKVCQTCPVRVQCSAAGDGETAGVWGGHLAGASPIRKVV